MPKAKEVSVDLDDLNHSELVLLCQWLGMKASRAVPRNALVSSILSLSPLAYTDTVDGKRKILSEWLKRNWDCIRMQAQKKVCPNCYECRDLQVLECYRLNKKSLGGR